MSAANEFQAQMWNNHLVTRPHSHSTHDLEWTALAMVGEAGELANEVKKVARDDLGLSPERRERILSEAGDTLIYLALIAHQMGESMDAFIAGTHRQGMAWFDRRSAR